MSIEYVIRLDPLTIPKYVNQLPILPVWDPIVIKDPCTGEVVREETRIEAVQFQQQVLPQGYPKTTVWGYGGMVKFPNGSRVYYSSTPGATFEATRGIPIKVEWINKLTDSEMFATDPTLHWFNPNNMPMDPPKPWPPFPPGFPQAQSPVGIVTHLHGGETQSIFDGGPDAWYTPEGKKGPTYVTNIYNYLNTQLPTTLWYHNHTLGVTRLSVYSGLAGMYIIRDPNSFLEQSEPSDCSILPSGKYEIPLVIQDRSFNTDGSLFFTNIGDNPDIHPYWAPEFFGDTIMVNGNVWPNLNVERRQYRFRVLNGSNARFYNLKLSNGQSFTQIGSDGGYLPKPVQITSLMVAPGERVDILINFSKVAPGTTIILQNDAAAPFPSGDLPNPATTGQIMQFTVPTNASPPVTPPLLPPILNVLPQLIPNEPARTLVLFEVDDPVTGNPTVLLLNGQKWGNPISKLPRVGATEDWVLVNLTPDAHPIHLHLVQFRVLNRQAMDTDNYTTDWLQLNGMPPFNHPTQVLPLEPYLQGDPISPGPDESGWKDTVRATPTFGTFVGVTRIRVRYAPQDALPATLPGVNRYPFDPTLGPGYVWHCHILDHEDNEMMRPYKVVKNATRDGSQLSHYSLNPTVP